MNKKEEKLKKEFIDIILNLENYEYVDGFLKNMFTEGELSEFLIRLQILKRLKKGISQRKIASDLDISIATVSRGSREIKYKKTKFLESL